MDTENWPTIICDIDGVLADVVPDTLIELYRIFGVLATPEDVTFYNMGKALHEFFPVNRAKRLNELLFRLWEETDIYARARPYFDIMTAMRWFKEEGGKLILATARPDRGEVGRMTQRWVEFWLGKIQLHFVKDKAGVVERHLGTKSYEAPGPPVWFVDDCHATCMQVYEMYMQRGKTRELVIYMPERPWNTALFAKPIVRRYIVQDIEELAREDL